MIFEFKLECRQKSSVSIHVFVQVIILCLSICFCGDFDRLNLHITPKIFAALRRKPTLNSLINLLFYLSTRNLAVASKGNRSAPPRLSGRKRYATALRTGWNSGAHQPKAKVDAAVVTQWGVVAPIG